MTMLVYILFVIAAGVTVARRRAAPTAHVPEKCWLAVADGAGRGVSGSNGRRGVWTDSAGGC